MGLADRIFEYEEIVPTDASTDAPTYAWQTDACQNRAITRNQANLGRDIEHVRRYGSITSRKYLRGGASAGCKKTTL